MPAKASSKPTRRFVRKTKAERQREIVDATVKLLGQYGLQGVTVSRIAAAVGIARGALYQHFPNREAVLEAALKTWGEHSSAWITAPVPTDVRNQLIEIADAHSSWSLSKYNSFVRPFYQLIASNRESGLTKRITARQNEDFLHLVSLVDEGKRRGSIRDDVESGDVAWSVLAHAWSEDVARLMGVDRFITEGVSGRLFKRLLSTYAADPGTGPTASPTGRPTDCLATVEPGASSPEGG